MTRLAVITPDRVRVMDGRRQIAIYDANHPTAEEIEDIRVAPEEPLAPPPAPRKPTINFKIPAWGQL